MDILGTLMVARVGGSKEVLSLINRFEKSTRCLVTPLQVIQEQNHGLFLAGIKAVSYGELVSVLTQTRALEPFFPLKQGISVNILLLPFRCRLAGGGKLTESVIDLIYFLFSTNECHRLPLESFCFVIHGTFLAKRMGKVQNMYLVVIAT